MRRGGESLAIIERGDCVDVVVAVGCRMRSCTTVSLLPRESWPKRSMKSLKTINQRCQSNFIIVKRTKNQLSRWWKTCRSRWVTMEEGDREGIRNQKRVSYFFILQNEFDVRPYVHRRYLTSVIGRTDVTRRQRWRGRRY